MKKYTLLELVQEVGRSINSDEITTLDESVEAVELAALAVSTISDIVNRDYWEFMSDRLITVPVTSGFKCVLPANVIAVQGVYVSSASVNDQVIPYAMPEFFIRRAAILGGTAVSVEAGATVELQPTGLPKSYTTFDEQELILFNNDPANTIKIRARISLDVSGAGTAVSGFVPTWIPDIPLRMFNYWLLETQAAASAIFRQLTDQRLEMMAQRAHDELRDKEPVTRHETVQRRVSLALDERERNLRSQQPQNNGGQQ